MRLDGKRILVAEDEERLIRLLVQILEAEGAEVLHADNGEDAFSAATTGKPDLVIMDLYMPTLDGFGAIESLRMVMMNRPILVLSGYSTDENRRRAEAAGASACLDKPFHRNDLLRVVCELLEDPDLG